MARPGDAVDVLLEDLSRLQAEDRDALDAHEERLSNHEERLRVAEGIVKRLEDEMYTPADILCMVSEFLSRYASHDVIGAYIETISEDFVEYLEGYTDESLT